LKFSAWDSIYC